MILSKCTLTLKKNQKLISLGPNTIVMRESDWANMPITPPPYRSPFTSTSNLVNHLINFKVGKNTSPMRLYDNDRFDSSQYDYLVCDFKRKNLKKGI